MIVIMLKEVRRVILMISTLITMITVMIAMVLIMMVNDNERVMVMIIKKNTTMM